MSSLVKNYKITDGGYKNNADTVYGELKDGTYFAYYPEMDLVEVYDCPVDELIDILYYNTTHEDELSEEEYQEKYNTFCPYPREASECTRQALWGFCIGYFRHHQAQAL